VLVPRKGDQKQHDYVHTLWYLSDYDGCNREIYRLHGESGPCIGSVEYEYSLEPDLSHWFNSYPERYSDL
jgi:hypothetical protein